LRLVALFFVTFFFAAFLPVFVVFLTLRAMLAPLVVP
jgi:hypothetical protein